MALSDAELVAMANDGRTTAFAELVARYEAAVRAVTVQILGHNEDAKEAAQEAFVRAYEKLGDLRNPNVFGPWLKKIARRCAIDTANHKSREKASGLVEDNRVVDCSSSGFGEEADELLDAVARLGVSQKQVISLRYFSGLSVKDVATVLGRSVSTVTKQLSRAHKRLRDVLEEKAND